MKQNRFLTFAILLNLLLLSQFAFSQGIKVIGVVKSAEDATSLPGVSIYVDGMSSIGTSTDLDGKYEITVPSSAEKLVFQSVGFETQVVTINSRTIINIVLKTEALDIEQVVVTGYTVQRKEA
ncbi:MAG: carboxypeptidase-like regulatory domain-containing protein, partial [Bacteroidales bacterium]|nr:carboxypeptidase-like regulatory domain-containing protein [Bacteroidales bacterium]